jgi:hypothetical protein
MVIAMSVVPAEAFVAEADGVADAEGLADADASAEADTEADGVAVVDGDADASAATGGCVLPGSTPSNSDSERTQPSGGGVAPAGAGTSATEAPASDWTRISRSSTRPSLLIVR